MANPVYCEPLRIDESIPSLSVPLLPPWMAGSFYDDGPQSATCAEPTATPFPSSMPTAPAVFWGASPPEPIGWESEPTQEDSCSAPPVGAYGASWTGMHLPNAPSSLHSSCGRSFRDNDSWRSLSPSSQGVHEEYYSPPRENYYGPSEYFAPPEHPPRSPDYIALQEVQSWRDHSVEDQFQKEQGPYHPTHDLHEGYQPPPKIKIELDAHSPFSPAAHHVPAENFEDDRKSDRLSPSSACHSTSTKSSDRLTRPAKIVKPRIKTRARPARSTKRMTRDGSGPALNPRGAATTRLGQCPHCTQTLKNNAALHKHITVTHTRPFSCVLSPYGCPATFGSKNEWKRHVGSQHLRPCIWRCRLEGCRPCGSSPGGDDADDEEETPIYNDFNRKDLFTQHLRRMHTPPELAGPGGDKIALGTWLTDTSQRCRMEQRPPPERAACGFCAQVFEGPQAWELRMEHVGRHLETGGADEQHWTEDVSLRDWMADQGLLEQAISGQWVLVKGPQVTTPETAVRKDTRGR